MAFNLQAGDILLTGKRNLFSRVLQWRLNGSYSHCIPMVSESQGLNTDILRNSSIENVEKYFSGDFRVLRLRCSDIDIDKFTLEASMLDGLPYDLRSYAGFLVNKNTEDPDKINCGEAALLCCHAGGILKDRPLDRISPQSFYEFSMAELFDIEELC